MTKENAQQHNGANDSGPSEEEKALLDEALAEFDRDGDPGMPWREALHRIRSSTAR